MNREIKSKTTKEARGWWLTPIILVIQEVESGGLQFEARWVGHIVCKTISQKYSV
jgi:hypothetical protein